MWDLYIDVPTPFIPVWEEGKTDTPIWRMTQEEAELCIEQGIVRFQNIGDFPIVHVEYAEDGTIKALFISANPREDTRS